MIFQAKPPTPAPEPEKIIRREMKKNQIHTFRVHVVSGSELDPSNVSYTFTAKTVISPNSTGNNVIEFKVENYSIEAEGLKYHAKLTGAGKLGISDTGLPDLLMDNVRDTKFWYPLLSFYLPSEVKDDAFEADEAVSAGVQIHGKGNIKDNQYDLTGSLDQGPTQIATLTLKWTVDPKGWLVSADGTIKDSNGATTFTLRSRS